MTDEELKNRLEEQQNKQSLDLKNLDLTSSQIEIVSEFLKTNTTIKDLDILGSMKNGGVEHLAQFLRSNTTLESLILSDNGIGDSGAAAIAEALQYNTTLQVIYLSDNGIGDSGAVAIAKALRFNAILGGIYLSDNGIGDSGAVAIAEALQYNTTLRIIRLNDNEFRKDGIKHFAEVFKKNLFLNGIGLGNFDRYDISFTSDDVNNLITPLWKNKTLISVPVFFSDQETNKQFVAISHRNRDYIKKFAKYLTEMEKLKGFLNLGDVKYLLQSSEPLLDEELLHLKEGNLPWGQGSIIKFWQENVFRILGICKNISNECKLPKEVIFHIFSFLSPHDFATKDFINLVSNKSDVDLSPSFIEEVTDEVSANGQNGQEDI